MIARLAAAGGRGQLEGQVSGPVDSLHVVVGAAEGAGGLGRVGGARGLRQSYGVIVAVTVTVAGGAQVDGSAPIGVGSVQSSPEMENLGVCA